MSSPPSIKNKSGIEDLNNVLEELDDMLTGTDKKKKRTDHIADSSSKDGRANAHARASNHGNGRYSAEASASIIGEKTEKEFGHEESFVLSSKAKAEYGPGGAVASARASAAISQYKSDAVDLDVLKADGGGALGAGPGGVVAKVDLGVTILGITNKKNGQTLEFRPNVDTGLDIGPEGVNTSVAGFGFSIGRKFSIKTPFFKFTQQF